MSFKVIKSGFMSTIQDLGRFGFADKGIARAGVADIHAACWANYLLQNASDAALIEITFGGCELEAVKMTTIAITGADFEFKLNGELKENWQVLTVHKGDRLSWGSSLNGVRAYIAVVGGFQTPVSFNSRSVNVREHIGKIVQTGDEIPTSNTVQSTPSRTLPSWFKPNYSEVLTLRLLPSYQFEQFDLMQRQTLLAQTYEVDRGSDRTGCRLTGDPIEHVPDSMISEGIAYGSVEITPAGLPIILMNDHPTIGGYPKIGTVFSLDLAQLAQRHPGAKVKFELIDIHAAQTLRQKFDCFFGV